MNNLKILIVGLVLGVFLTLPFYPISDAKDNNIDSGETYRGANSNREDNHDELKGGFKAYEQRGLGETISRHDEG
ncbi:MAG: hypothetical protein J7K40_00245 [candidate division Zixibacteria bacterium]|nr:hypothetical protein [candidate division Zixibacteria bacterium]